MPKIKGVTVTQRQAEVLSVVKQYGPIADHALVPLAQHQLQVHQSSSGLRTRRKELVAAGLVKPVGVTLTGSGRKAITYKAV